MVSASVEKNVFARAMSVQSLLGFDRQRMLALGKVSSVGLFVIGIMAASGVAVKSILTVGGIGGSFIVILIPHRPHNIVILIAQTTLHHKHLHRHPSFPPTDHTTSSSSSSSLLQPFITNPNFIRDPSLSSSCSSVLKKYPSKFVGCCLANPEEDGIEVKQLEELVLKDGFCADRFNPYLWPAVQKILF